MALDKDLTHATMLNSSSQNVLIFYRTDGNGATVHQLGILVPFHDCYFTEALRTVHFTV